jgi:inorganic pyrophosphatase
MPNETPLLLTQICTFRKNQNELNVIIETPKGSRNKLDYEPDLGVFELAGVLPEGSVFPYDFGFVPSTLGEDGDPLDVLVLLDESVPTGCLISARLIGVIEADQTEQDGQTTRNNRLLAVATRAHTHADVKTLDDVRPKMVEEIEHFFISYNQTKEKTFKPTGRGGPDRALQLVREGAERLISAEKP